MDIFIFLHTALFEIARNQTCSVIPSGISPASGIDPQEHAEESQEPQGGKPQDPQNSQHDTVDNSKDCPPDGVPDQGVPPVHDAQHERVR